MANVIKHKRGSGSDPGASDLILGELAIRTDTGKLFTKMDSGAIAEIAGGGSDIAINTLSSSSGTGGGSATFNGSAYRFTLSQPPNVSAAQLLVSINGVIQKPVAGTGQPSEGFSVDGTDIILGDAPATGSDFFILTFKSLGVSEPADNSVTSAKIVDGAIVNADINASAAIAGTKISSDFGSQNITTLGNIICGDGSTGVLNIKGNQAFLQFTDANNNDDFEIRVDGGIFRIQDQQNDLVSLQVNTDGHVDIPVNLDVGAGIDVTGAITGTGDLTIDTNTLYVDSTNNRVGIGTTSPATLLNLNVDTEANLGSGSEGIRLTSGSSNAQLVRLGSSYSNNSVTGPGTLLYSSNKLSIRCDNSNPITFHTGSTVAERMRIDSSGRLLAGSTSTANNGRIQGFIAHGTTAGESGITSVDTNSMAAGVGGEIAFYGKTSSSGYNYLGHVRGIKENGTDTNTACALTFHTRPTLTAPQERMRIDSSGRLIVGATSGAGKFIVQDSSLPKIQANFNGTAHLESGVGGSGGGFAITTGHFLTFNHQPYANRGTDTNLTERMRIDSSGNVGIGTTSPSAKIHADNGGSGNVAFLKHASSGIAVTLTLQNNRATGSIAGEQISFLDDSGTQRGKITNTTSSTTYATSSDYRLKENEKLISDGIERVKQLKPYKFNWKHIPNKTVDGFFAHEVQNLVEDCVDGTKDRIVTKEDHDKGDYLDKEIGTEIHQMMDHSKLVPLLVAALQEAIGRIEALEAK